MKLPDNNRRDRRALPAAFTLIEVMIAIAIFFMAMFTILGVLSTSLHAALILRNSGPTAGMVAAQLSLTNKLEAGSDSGNFSDIPIYDGYRWISETTEATTNGLYKVEFAVINPSGKPDSTLTILLYRPDAQGSHLGLH
jgi:type II secretory pathway pseudopilin PulG